MHGNAPAVFIAALLIATVPNGASSAAPLSGAGSLATAAERLAPIESIHYYGYGRGYYGYGRGYYGYGRGYYGYGRGYYGYGRGYYPYGRGYYGYRYY